MVILSGEQSGEMTQLHFILNTISVFISEEAKGKILIYNLVFIYLVVYI